MKRKAHPPFYKNLAIDFIVYVVYAVYVIHNTYRGVMEMQPTIEVSNEILKDLSDIAVPFEDTTPAHVIKRLIAEHNKAQSGNGAEVVHTYSTVAPPDLKHTKVLDAKINGRVMLKPNWNSIMDRVINAAAHKLKDGDKLDELILCKHIKGEKTDQGFRHLLEAGVSVQGQDATNAWKTSANIIKALGFPAEVTFEWYSNPKAANPGEVGKFVFGPPV
jgi:hypothetical protein